SEHKLERADLGFPAAARGVAEALGLADFAYTAKQAAVARYSRVGFEAAAVTGMAMAAGVMTLRDGGRPVPRLRVGPPSAVGAGAAQPDGPWHGLPVFSAWVADPADA